MSYTIDTLENSSTITVDDEYVRRSFADQGWEMTDRPVLNSPVDGATGITTIPEFEWDQYVKDIPIENPVYRLEVVEIATPETTPDWTNPFRRVTEETSADLREELDPSKAYAWRLFAHSRILPLTFEDDFDRAELGTDYSTQILQGDGDVRLENGSLIIEGIPTAETGRQLVRLLLNVENPEILMENVVFSNVSSSFQPGIYFNTQGEWMDNNQVNGYYWFFLGGESRLGKVVNNPGDLQARNFTRSVGTPYNMWLKPVNGHLRLDIWESSESKPSTPLHDFTDSDPYTSGGVDLISVVTTALSSASMTVGKITITFAEGDPVDVTDVVVTGSTSDLTAGQTRQFQYEVQGTNVQQSATWSATGGTITQSGVFTADSSPTPASVTATSTQDETVSGTLNFNVVEESEDTSLNSSQGDFEALQAIYNATDGGSLQTLPSTNDLPSLSNAEYPFMYLINGDIHYVEFNRDFSPKSWKNAGAPWSDATGWDNMTVSNMGDAVGVEVDGDNRVIDFDMQKITTTSYSNGTITTGNNLCGVLPAEVGNLKRCKRFNVKQNFLFGALPAEFGLIGTALERLSLAGLSWELDMDEKEDYNEADHYHYITGSDPYDWSSGHSKAVQDTNRFKTELPAEWGNLTGLDIIELTWQFLQGGLPPSWGNLVNLRGIFLDKSFDHNDNRMYSTIPSEWGNMTNMRYFRIGNYQGYKKLHGNLPSGMLNWDNLVNLNLINNDLEGSFPHFQNVTDLYYFSIDSNNFSGDFPFDAVFNGTDNLRLDKFSVANNNFTGTPPASFTSYTNFSAQYFNGNNFEGKIPKSDFRTSIINWRDNPGITSHDVDFTHYRRQIKTVRWRNCSIRENIPEWDWYNFYNQQTNGHPLRNFTIFRVQGNRYTENNFNWTKQNAFPWEDQNRPMIWYYQNMPKDGSGNCGILQNVDPNFSKSDYLNAGFSQAVIDQYGGSTGYEWMRNMLNLMPDSWQEFNIGNQDQT